MTGGRSAAFMAHSDRGRFGTIVSPEEDRRGLPLFY